MLRAYKETRKPRKNHFRPSFMYFFLASWLPVKSSSLPIQLRCNNVQTSQHRDDVAERVAFDQVRKNRKVDERRRATSRPVRRFAAVAREVKAQFAVGRL